MIAFRHFRRFRIQLGDVLANNSSQSRRHPGRKSRRNMRQEIQSLTSRSGRSGNRCWNSVSPNCAQARSSLTLHRFLPEKRSHRRIVSPSSRVRQRPSIKPSRPFRRTASRTLSRAPTQQMRNRFERPLMESRRSGRMRRLMSGFSIMGRGLRRGRSWSWTSRL